MPTKRKVLTPKQDGTVRMVNGRTPQVEREIVILGYAEESRDMVHGLPETVDIWAINMSHVFLKKRKAHTWFQLHPRNWTTGGRKPTGYWGRPKEHLDFLQKFEGPVYMSYEEPDVPNCKVFDIDDVLAKLRLGMHARHYFTSTFAYIMALAITEKPSKIYLYGINLTALDEYTKQRNCMEYWIGQAEGRGIEIEIPSESALCKAPDYGLGVENPDEEMVKHFMDRLQRAKDKYMEAAFDVNTAETLRTDTEYWVGVLDSVAEKFISEWQAISARSKTLKQMRAAIEELGTQAQAAIQEKITARVTGEKEMSQRMMTEMNGRMGQMKELQHAIGLFGAIDVRAPALPAPRFPNPELAKDLVIPKPQAV